VSRLVWVDRNGKELETVGSTGDYRDLALSPDGSRLAYGVSDGRQDDIWVRDLRRDVSMRLTAEGANEIWPVWSPDGSRIVFSSDGAGAFVLMSRSSSGTGSTDTLLAVEGTNLGGSDWSRDGRWLAFASIVPGSRPDLEMLPMDGSKKPSVFVADKKVVEFDARFSPDGRWVAYQSDESGEFEIYIQPFPPTGAKWTVSNGGGRNPQWRSDGKELFYRGPDDTIEAVPVAAGATLDVGRPVSLFSRALQGGGIYRNRFVVGADGQRFLLNVATEKQASAPFSVVLNWPAGL
jgi:Tol biopolymer transport system component